MIVNQLDLDTVLSMAEVLVKRADTMPHSQAFTFLENGKDIEQRISYLQLDTDARSIAALLQNSCMPGDRVLLVAPSGLDYIRALMACFYAGVVTVPVYPPTNSASLGRFNAIAQDCQPRLILSTHSARSSAVDLCGNDFLQDEYEISSSWIEFDNCDLPPAGQWREILPGSEDIALLQYTSGSTGDPKGVMLTHGNLIANEKTICEVYSHDESLVGMGWLPFFHDMGLIGNLLQTLFVGAHTVLMDPYHFVRDPLNWLRAVSKYRATTSGGPNFAYELLARRLARSELLDLDLRHWRVAFCGAEPIRHDTLLQFAKAAEPYGFDHRAFNPCYGLAEATLMVTGCTVGEGMTSVEVDAEKFRAGSILLTDGDKLLSKKLVSSGSLTGNQEVIILQENSCTDRCGEREIGEICVIGNNIAQGYWNNKQKSEETFPCIDFQTGKKRVLRTGDLGFLLNGHLFVTGRIKDLIIINGRNFYPQDIEESISQIDAALRTGNGACFSVDNDGTEHLIAVQEIAIREEERAQEIANKVFDRVFAEHTLNVFSVVFIKRGTIPKTTSGKIRRRECKRRYEHGELQVLYEFNIRDRDKAQKADAENREDSGILAVIKAELSQCADVGEEQLATTTNLAQLGMDSIKLIAFKQALEERFSIDIEIGFLINNCTLEKLEEKVSEHLRQETSLNPEEKHRVGKGDTFPLTCGQQSLWYLQCLEPQSPVYHISRAFNLSRPLDPDLIQRAIDNLCEKHPALNTQLHVADSGEVNQKFDKGFDSPLILIEDSLTFDELDREIDKYSSQPFDYTGGRLFRVVYFNCPDSPVLLFVFHHLICDFESLLIFYQDFCKQLSSNPALTEPGSEFPGYQEFISEQESYRGTVQAQMDLRYWRNSLTGKQIHRLPFPEPLLPSGDDTYRAEEVFFDVPAGVSRELKQLACTASSSSYSMLLGLLQVYLSVWSGIDCIALGTALTLRQKRKSRSIFGYAVNPVPMVQNMDKTKTVRAWAGETAEHVRKAVVHGRVPFSDIVEACDLRRGNDASELFDSVLTYFALPDNSDTVYRHWALQSAAKDSINIGGTHFTPRPITSQFTQFALDFQIADSGERFVGKLVYRRAIVTRSLAEHLVAGWLHFLKWCAENQDNTLSRYRQYAAGTDSRVRIDRQNNPYLVDKCLHELFESNCDTAPDALALLYKGRAYSYLLVEERSNRIAQYLHARNFGKSTIIALLMDPSPQLVCALIGVCKAGLAFVNMSSKHPGERLRHIYRDCNPILMLVDKSIKETLGREFIGSTFPDLEIVAVPEIEEAPEFLSFPINRLNIDISVFDTAYYAYTSGSTGVPKGIVHCHANLCSFIQWQSEVFEISGGACMAQLASIVFDVSYCEIFGALCFGAALSIFEQNQRGDPERMLQALSENPVTVLQVVPGYFQQVLEKYSSWSPLQKEQTPLGIQHVLFVGERLNPEVARRAMSLFPETRFYNVYGPTECVAATCFELSLTDLPASIPVGTGVAGREIHVLDDGGNECPPGTAGEICIGGQFLSAGYKNLPEQTANAYAVYANEGLGRLYHTGDLGKWSEDRKLLLIGRKDNQVKISGIRIELDEVDACIASCEMVAEGISFVEEVNGSNVLCACLILKEEFQLEAFYSCLARKLIAQMVPSRIYTLAKLPRNLNGKIDRKALKDNSELKVLLNGTAGITGVQTRLEHEIATVIKSVLQCDHLAVDDNFFNAGGNSLLAMQCVNRLNKVFNVVIPLHDFVSAPTIKNTAKVILKLHEDIEIIQFKRSQEILNQIVRMADEEVDAALADIQG